MESLAGACSNSYLRLISAIGNAALGDLILRFAVDLAGAEEIFGFCVGPDELPRALISAGRRGSSRHRVSRYVEEYHTLDPVLPFALAAPLDGSFVSMSVSPCDITDSGYRRDCFELAGLTKKISYVQACPQGTYVLSVYGSGDRGLTDCRDLRTLAQYTLPVLKRHDELLSNEQGLSLRQRLEHRLERTYPMLSRRERQVCARTLSGLTAEATALELGIAESSVLTYRRRAYERYQISSANQLLENLIS